jgi:phosphohistidine phosphatase
MQLYIVRHGIAVDRQAPKAPTEAERYLTEDGKEKAQQVAVGLGSLGVAADVMYSSPYVRAMQTAEIFADVLEYPKTKIWRTDLLLPDADPALFFRELAKDKDSSVVIVFGHAPHLDDLLATAIGSRHQVTALKKAGIALIELKRVSPPSGELVWLATPKILRRMAK